MSYNGKSLASYGDISTLSFHATKLFHTVEGGAIITNDDELAHKVSYMRNFGHKGQEDFWGLGINGKNSEFHAAMGLCNLPHLPEIIAARKQVSIWYDELLIGSGLVRPSLPEFTKYNFAYYPVVFPTETSLIKSRDHLSELGIFPRRYFYPSLSNLMYLEKKKIEIADRISSQVLCLPIYCDLKRNDVHKIVSIIQSRSSLDLQKV